MASNDKRFKASIILGGAVSSSLRAAFGSTEKSLKRLGGEIGGLDRRQRQLGKAIQTLGRLGKNVDGLRQRYAETTAQVDRLRRAQERLNVAQARHLRLSEAGGRLRSAGLSMGVTGALAAVPLAAGIGEAKQYQLEQTRIQALGMGDKVTRQAVGFARDLKTFGTSQVENLTLMRDALSVFGDLGHAKMATPILSKIKFANAALYGQEGGGERDQKFIDMLKVIELRGGTKSESDFKKQSNMVQQVLSASGGRIGPEEWKHLISTGGLAAKSLRDDAFYYQLAPLVQEMGGDRAGTGLSSAYASIYQGHTTKRAAINLQKYGLISDKSKVKFDKVGQVAQINPGAIKGADLYRQSPFEWVKQVLIPTLAQHGVTQRNQILDSIGSIFSNRNGGDFISTMYLQQQQIEKDERVARGSADIDTLNKGAQDTAAGKQLKLEQEEADLKLRLGNTVLPLYVKGLNFAANAMDRLNGILDRHPRAAKMVGVALASVTGALLVLGPAAIAAGAALSAYAGYTLLVERFGVAGSLLGGQLTSLRSAMDMAVLGLRTLTTGVMVLGRALLLNPIGLALTAIAGAAYIVYKNWDKIGPYAEKVWGRVSAISKALFYTISDWWGDLFKSMRHWVSEFFGWLKSMPLGRFIPAARALGPGGNQLTGLQKSLLAWADHTNAAHGAPTFAGVQSSASTVNAKAPANVHVHNNNTYNIHQQPGQSADQLARHIAHHSAQQSAAHSRAALYDGVGH